MKLFLQLTPQHNTTRPPSSFPGTFPLSVSRSSCSFFSEPFPL
uniref:Uncharacterized protein n=1 Tax=Rhizophora mucronata TaxID=61149 RepID=A0A2P2P9V8_RHIMU